MTYACRSIKLRFTIGSTVAGAPVSVRPLFASLTAENGIRDYGERVGPVGRYCHIRILYMYVCCMYLRAGAGFFLYTLWPKNGLLTQLTVFTPHAGPSGAYSPDGTMGYMMDGQQMMHRPPGDPTFHNQYTHYPEYYGHHLWGKTLSLFTSSLFSMLYSYC